MRKGCTVEKLRTDHFRVPEVACEWRGLPSDPPQTSPAYSDWLQFSEGEQHLQESYGHPYYLLGKGTGDIGGDFSVVRREYSDGSPKYFNRTVDDDTNPNAYNYQGRYFAVDQDVTTESFPEPLYKSDFELDALGTSAIASVIPTNPISGVLVTLGELKREGIPSLIGANTWRDRTLRAKNAGSEYLNYQFGWLPLVSEIQTFAGTVLRSDEISRQYQAESGKLLHRQYTFPTEITTNRDVETGIAPVPHIKVGYFSSLGDLTRITTQKYESWFSGAFTYYLPPEGTIARSAAVAHKLYGTRLTPDVVWNLTPWSWAVDWFTNVGDVVSNISAFQNDGLVMPYAYIMSRTTHKVEYFLNGAITKYGSRPVNVWQSFTTTVKQRRKATPYGFGLTLGGLSTRQWSIMAALGLTRGTTGMKYE